MNYSISEKIWESKYRFACDGKSAETDIGETWSRVARGAMMGTLRCDHPDIAAFIDSEREHDALQNFNLSVLITDDFMQAVANDSEW